jgi:hypothetical protein
VDTEAAAEILMVSQPALRCWRCAGTGAVPGKNIDARRRGDDEYVFCGVCKGARVVVNPIWNEAWLIIHPNDHAGIKEVMVKHIQKAVKSISFLR